ncbi:helix-turn-helix domain-containing protein [Glycocaulis sp.]|uniref:helix-turn-helix domain-containing protein n=1 Tax=Glycocaulis sp. TaxID=1969725 RepID=UPI003D1BBF10
MANTPDTPSGKSGQPRPASGAMLTKDQIAAELGCSRKQVERFIASGDLIATRFGPRMVRVHRRDLEAFIAWKRKDRS